MPKQLHFIKTPSPRTRQIILTLEHPGVADCHEDIGLVYEDMGEYSKALSYHEIHQTNVVVRNSKSRMI